MSATTQRGYLLLADLSGYTSFLSIAELEHARDVLSELLELVVRGLTPAMTLCEVEGDGVYVYAPETTFARGETLLELVESTYAAFRGRLGAISRRTTCTCKACLAIPSLDLKFIVHFGEYVLQSVAGTSKPLGPAVTLLHRLVKNHVSEVTGWRAYALFTADCLARLGLGHEGLHVQPERYPSLGELATYSLDLAARYQEAMASRRICIRPEEADAVLIYDLPAPPPAVWEWLNEPGKRSLWEGFTVTLAARSGERSGAGMVSHCVHGGNVVSIQTVVDWRPFEYFSLEHAKPGAVGRMGTGTTWLEAIPTGTRVVDVFRVEMRPHALAVLLFKLTALPEMRRSISRLTEMVRQETLIAGRAVSEAGGPANAHGAPSGENRGSVLGAPESR